MIRRGPFRLWVLGSIFWVGITSFVASDDGYSLAIYVKTAFLPPLAVLAIGLALLWALKGFARD